MSETIEPIFYDRTRVTTDWKCRRRRLAAFEFGGRGISPRRRAFALDFGIVTHDVFAALLLSGDLDTAVRYARTTIMAVLGSDQSEAQTEDARKIMEMAAVVEGMVRGWYRHVYPWVMENHRVIKVEGEVVFDHDGCRLGSKPDLLLERISDNTLGYVEWKSSGLMTERYFNSYHKAVQMPAGALAVAQTLNRTLDWMIVYVVYKGKANRRFGRQESIFAYGYAPPSSPRDLSYKYRPGLWRFPVWEAMSVEQWVREMPEEVLTEQFGDTGPVFIQQEQITRWLKQTAIREKEIRTARDQLFGGAPLARVEAEEILDRVFPQNFDQCTPVMGGACPYRDFCFLDHVFRDPVGSGLYEWREPHHTTDPEYDDE